MEVCHFSPTNGILGFNKFINSKKKETKSANKNANKKKPSKEKTVHDCSVRPGSVKNGKFGDCKEKDGKIRCDLQCAAGFIPAGNGKWVCNEKGKIEHPVHNCVPINYPEPGVDCRTPHLEHGFYACSWNKFCTDPEARRRRDDDEGSNRGKKDKVPNGACLRECKVTCDLGWKPLSGDKEAVCVRKSLKWIKPHTVCVPDNYIPDKKYKPSKGFKVI